MERFEADNRDLRAYADKSAKAEADRTQAVTAAQVQGLRDAADNLKWAGGLVVPLLLVIFGFGAWRAVATARDEALAALQGEGEAIFAKINASEMHAGKIVVS